MSSFHVQAIFWRSATDVAIFQQLSPYTSMPRYLPSTGAGDNNDGVGDDGDDDGQAVFGLLHGLECFRGCHEAVVIQTSARVSTGPSKL